MMEKRRSILEAVESVAHSVEIPLLNSSDLVINPQAVVSYPLAQAVEEGKRWRDRFKTQCDKVVKEHEDVLDYEDKDRVEGNKPVVADRSVKIVSGKLTEDLKKATPYMLRNDGELLDVTPIHPYIKYGHESVEVALSRLATTRFPSLEWFYTNTNSEDTKQLIRVIAKYLLIMGKVAEVDFCDLTEDIPAIDSREVDGYLQELNDNTNQEFCRVRTSGLIFGGSSNEIYFRISSIGFNWFDLIWELVYKYRAAISDVTICKDSNAFGGRFDPYKINGQPVNHLPVSEFLICSGNPVVESVPSKTEAINEATRAFSAGKLVSEAYDKQLHPIHIHSFYETQVSERLNEDLDHLLIKTKAQSLTEALEESLVKAPALGLDEITPFFEICDRLGIETLGDFERFMREYGRDKDPITALKDYFIDELEDLDFRAKKESLAESVNVARCRDILNNDIDWSEIDEIGDVDLAVEQLRSLNTEGEISDDEYNYIMSHWDELLELKSLNESAEEESSQEPEEEVEEDQLSPLVKVDLGKFKPWGNAVDTYNQIKAADKMYDLEKLIEKAWPNGIEDATLNDLLAEDRDFLETTLDMKFEESEN